MAKKKKRKSREEPEPNLFWRQAAAVLLFVAGAFLLLGGFGIGGLAPIKIFSVIYSGFGWAAYLTPIALFYFAVVKFQTDDHKVPLANSFSMVLLLAFLSAWLFTGFADQTAKGAFEGGYGGAVGAFLGGLALKILSSFTASILLLVLAMLSFMFSFGISPLVLAGLINLFKRPELSEEDEMHELSAAANKRKFELKEGVPIEHKKGSGSAQPVAAAKLSAKEEHSALVAPSDPNWKFPSIDLLNQKQDKADPGDVEAIANTIQDSLSHFDIDVEMEGANIGPRITQYTLKPPAGVKLTKISALDDNIALDLGAQTIRIEAPIPGKKAVGIEVPNEKQATVRVSSIVGSSEWKATSSPLAIPIGKDIAGTPVVGALDDMPHVLIAGQTKSGKSVMINSLLTGLLYRNSPSDLKLILIDPKQVEMAPYEGIPHLLTPVIDQPDKAISALKWAVAEMERRYRALREEKKRNIADYNAVKKEEGMPYIVIVIDEMADLMMAAGRDVEGLIVRIAQKARAVGIHLVLATQSPRATVITGLIKANIPARIAFTVSQELESRIIMDSGGAEKLLGKGDMLYQTADMPRPKRIQGALITDEETHALIDFLQQQREPMYDDEVVAQPVVIGRGGVVTEKPSNMPAGEDELKDAVRVVLESGKAASTSYLQRRMGLGYSKAARLIDEMEERGIVGPSGGGSKGREVLITSMEEAFGSDSGDDEEEEEA